MQENEKKANVIVWALAITVTVLLSTIPMALQTQGDVQTAGERHPEISREELAKIDDELAVLMDLRDQWIVEGYPVEVAAEMRERIKNLQCLDIHHKFMKGLKSELDQGKVELVQKRERQTLPPRNGCNDIPGHVTCFKEHNGLVHGGVIKMPFGTTLVCRAFRLVYMTRYHGTHSYKRDERREVVVAGVCEKKDAGGQVSERWSTADFLPLRYIGRWLYASTSVRLPLPAVQRTSYKKDGERWSATWFGYYFPAAGMG